MILDGEWQNGKYGQQLQVTQCEEIVPQTKDGVKGYLSSRLIKGVGERTAELIVDRFGAEALKVLEKEPERFAIWFMPSFYDFNACYFNMNGKWDETSCV